MPSAAQQGYVIRVLRAGSSAPAGVGFLVGNRQILTCAHVVNAALGRQQHVQGYRGRTSGCRLISRFWAALRALRRGTAESRCGFRRR